MRNVTRWVGARCSAINYGVRLDRYDSYLTTFHATVVDRRDDQRGAWLRLNRSAFYPTSGGQPHDTGTLTGDAGEFVVTDVELGGEQVWLLLSGPGSDAPAVGAELRGAIDWPRRFLHMQRHSAQHLLSQALVRVDPALATESVSLTGPDCTIDCASEVNAETLAAVEAEVNRAARRGMAINAFTVDESRLSGYALRRPSKRHGAIRLVAIGNYDLVACGGTHLRNSAEALPVKLLGSERVRGGRSRITFRAGEEASNDHAQRLAVTSALGSALSAPLSEITERVKQLQAELTSHEKRELELQQRLAAGLVRSLAADQVGKLVSQGAAHGLVTAVLEGDEAQLLDAVITMLQQRPGLVSLLAAGQGEQWRFAFLAGPGCSVDLRPALRAALEPLGGKGGGRPDRAQGAASADLSSTRAALTRASAQLTQSRNDDG